MTVGVGGVILRAVRPDTRIVHVLAADVRLTAVTVVIGCALILAERTQIVHVRLLLTNRFNC